MADALCGPSNALKSFSGHLEQDRSLQQDRAGPSSQPQAGQFRTTDPNTAQAHDAHFHAAFNGGPVPVADFHHTLHMLQQNPSHITGQQHRMPVSSRQSADPAVPDWAAQFQQMTLGNSTSHAPAVYMPQQQPVQAQHMYLPASGLATHEPQQWYPPMQQQAFPMPMNAPQTFFPSTASSSQLTEDAEFAESMDQWMAQHGPRAEAAIDAEMESLARDMEAHDIARERLQANPENLEVQESVERFQEPDAESELSEEQKAANNADELAAAARRIVEVMDTTHANTKMKNSGFLSLMRRLADGDVTLRDQDFVDEHGDKVNVSDGRVVDETHVVSNNMHPPTTASPTWTPVDLTKPVLRE